MGNGVTSISIGDVVIPCYTPECKKHDCIFCTSHKTNLCPTIRSTKGQGLMPDGTSRLSKDGKQIFLYQENHWCGYNDAKLGATVCVNSMTCEGGDVKVRTNHA